MALMELMGIREMFDVEVRVVDGSARKLSVGMAVKAMTGTIFGCHVVYDRPNNTILFHGMKV